MVLGCFYLTIDNPSQYDKTDHYFANFEDVLLAYEQLVIKLHTFVWVRCTDIEIEKEEQTTNFIANKITQSEKASNLSFLNSDYKIKWNNSGGVNVKYIKTTPCRIL